MCCCYRQSPRHARAGQGKHSRRPRLQQQHPARDTARGSQSRTSLMRKSRADLADSTLPLITCFSAMARLALGIVHLHGGSPLLYACHTAEYSALPDRQSFLTQCPERSTDHAACLCM